jgi:hypothetical protein
LQLTREFKLKFSGYLKIGNLLVAGMQQEPTMPFSQLLGEDVDLPEALAGLPSQKGYSFSHHQNPHDLLKIIPQTLPSLIIIAPSRGKRWNALQPAAERGAMTKPSPLMVSKNQSLEAQARAN